jgi:hypothetical protein
MTAQEVQENKTGYFGMTGTSNTGIITADNRDF